MTDSFGNWFISGTFTGPELTATVTDGNGNTSEFSAPVAAPATPTPTPTPSDSLTPTPTVAPTATPSPTPTATPVPTASPTHSPTPTGTHGAAYIQGNVNSDLAVDEFDFELLIQYAAGLNDGTRPDPCPDLGEAILAVSNAHPWGDVNCDDHVTALDALYVLAHTVSIELPQTQPCTAISSPLT